MGMMMMIMMRKNWELGDNDDGFEVEDDVEDDNDDNDDDDDDGGNDELGTRPPSFVSTSDQFEIRRRCSAE